MFLASLVYFFTISHVKNWTQLNNMQNELKLLKSEMIKINEVIFSLSKRKERNSTQTIDSELRQQLPQFYKSIDIIQKDLTEVKVMTQKMKESSLNMLDYASEQLGGSIETTGNTKLLNTDVLYFLSFISNKPSEVLRPTKMPGDCFGYHGQLGEIVIRLQRKMFIESISIDHISTEMSPIGVIDTAPKQFRVYGLNTIESQNTHFFGAYQYEIEMKQKLQNFQFPYEMLANESFELVHLVFLSNHGNLRYTCIYRIKVHGRVADKIQLLN